MSSSKEWILDEATGKRVRYSEKKEDWVDEKGRRVDPPRRRASTTPAPKRGTSQQAGSGQDYLDDATAAMSRLNVNAPGQGGRQPPSSRGYASNQSGNVNATQGGGGRQPPSNSGPGPNQPAYQYGSSGGQPRDPPQAEHSRTTNPSSARPRNENPYRRGQVIAVRLEIPGSGITQGSFQQQNGAPVRRYVIVRVEGLRFWALLISTYGGRGVAAANVVKAYHSMIYTNQFRAMNPNEEPARGEWPMQATPILVVQHDRGTALDMMSRLNYSHAWEFDCRAPNIELFGYVHDQYTGSLFGQLGAVVQLMQSRASGPSTVTTDTIMTAPTVRPNQAAEPPRTDSNPTNAASRELQEAYTLFCRYREGGQCSETEMQRILDYLHNYAMQNNLPAYPPNVNPQQLQQLARNPQVRSQYLRRITASWTA